MDLNLSGKIIIVTGGARGIGEAITRALAAEGAIPAIIGKDEADNQKLVAELAAAKQEAYYVTAELTSPEACAAAVASVQKKFGRIDGLVNNAGINDGVGLASGHYEAFIASLHRNLVHYYLIAHHALPALKASAGAIVNITSKTAETGQGNTSGYAAANGGRNALTREWAAELSPFGVRVNAIVVAECFTPMYDTWLSTLPDREEKLKNIVARIPLGHRMTDPAEIASTAVFLLSSKSSHTTGQLIHVDGGYVHLDRAL